MLGKKEWTLTLEKKNKHWCWKKRMNTDIGKKEWTLMLEKKSEHRKWTLMLEKINEHRFRGGMYTNVGIKKNEHWCSAKKNEH